MSEESEAVQTHLPCPDCGSSDALALYDDGHTHCYSCDKTTQSGSYEPPERKSKKPRDLLGDLEYRHLPSRDITEETCVKFGYGIAADHPGAPAVAPYYAPGDRRTQRGQKLRGRGKKFSLIRYRRDLAGRRVISIFEK